MDFENILAYNLPKGLPSSVHHHSGGIQQRVVWRRIKKWWEERIFFPETQFPVSGSLVASRAKDKMFLFNTTQRIFD